MRYHLCTWVEKCQFDVKFLVLESDIKAEDSLDNRS